MYIRYNPPSADNSSVTLQADGRLHIGVNLQKKLGLTSAKYTIVYYDPEEKKIGLNFYSHKPEGALGIYHKKDSGGSYIHLRSMLHRFGIKWKKAKSCCISVDDNGMLEIFLGKVTPLG